MNVEEAERAVGYVFKDKRLLIKALTLASADQKENNQLLEFFGDALLEFIVSEKLYTSGGTEGGLTERRAGNRRAFRVLKICQDRVFRKPASTPYPILCRRGAR